MRTRVAVALRATITQCFVSVSLKASNTSAATPGHGCASRRGRDRLDSGMRELATAAQHAPRRRLETISSFSLPRWKYALYSISSVQAWKSRSSQHSQRSPTGKWPPSAPTPWECHRSPPTQDVCSFPSGTPRAGENRRRLSPKGAACKLRSAVGLRSKCDLRGAFSSAAADHSPHVDQRTIAQPALAPATPHGGWQRCA